MTAPEPTLRVKVDLTNPGQFFACCGLLELAHRLDRNALGWFDVGCFNLTRAPADLICQFLECNAEPIGLTDNDGESEADDSEKGEDKTVPIQLAAPFDLRLDWWNSDAAQHDKLKTWSAGQKVTDLLNGKTTVRKTKKGETSYSPSMRDHLKESVSKNPGDWLRVAEVIESPKAFGYDSRLSRNNALDLGYVGNSAMAFSPAVEVLSLVGLQRFRPWVIVTWSRNRYCTWRQPLSVDIAAVAALGVIPQFIDNCFEFPIKPRDAQGRYKLFGHAQPVRRSP